MKYKMTVLYYSKAGNAEALARAIAREQQTKADQIPPAYPCEAQKFKSLRCQIKHVENEENWYFLWFYHRHHRVCGPPDSGKAGSIP